MKTNRLQRHSVAFLLGAAMLAGMSSCESIYDKDQKCDPTYKVKFVYDMNMDYADAFAAKVNSVDLYVFDATDGDLKGVYRESGPALAQEGYTITLDLEPGDYDFIAWCGLDGNEGQFTVPQTVTAKHDLGCTLTRDRDASGKATSDKDLYGLYHGKLSANLPDDADEHLYTIELVKNTNNINLSLQELSGKPLDPDRFDIKLHASNGFMAYDNSWDDNEEEIEYNPYRKVGGSASVGTKADDDVITNDMVVAELSTARLWAEKNPVIDIIDNENGETVYSIPLVKWALMLKSSQYSRMKDQEYLDREDEYNVVLYISAKGDIVPEDPNQYIAVSVMINGWRLVLNGDTELH